MSFEDNLAAGENIYVIPKGTKDEGDVIKITPTTSHIRLAIYFPHEKYQVISDGTLKERGISLMKYIQDTER